MKWVKFSIHTTTEAEDIIISSLYDLGFEGAQIEDKVPLTAMEKEQMFVDILPEQPEDDGKAILSFFVEEDGTVDRENTIKIIEEELVSIREFMEIGEGTIHVEETEDIDWVNNWKTFFHQFRIDDLLVIPSWEEPEESTGYEKILHIDPGTAFGTGMHETTQLCIRQMKKFITSETRILDVGTGSGILGILGLMYGAKEIFGTDLDPCAVEAVEANINSNQINKKQFQMIIGNIITDETLQEKLKKNPFEIVVANILPVVLVPLTPVVATLLKEGGIYITSGILIEKVEEVKKAMKENGMEILDVTYQGEWASVTAKK